MGPQHRAAQTRLVDTVTTPLLLKLVQTGKLRPAGLVTHRFGLDDIMQAYDTFGDAARTSALKVVLKRPWGRISSMNASWHQRHAMRTRASLEQRVRWHLAHARGVRMSRDSANHRRGRSSAVTSFPSAAG